MVSSKLLVDYDKYYIESFKVFDKFISEYKVKSDPHLTTILSSIIKSALFRYFNMMQIDNANIYCY